MRFEYDDGGRIAAGHTGKTGDCVCRAIAIAARMPYEEVYQRLASGNANQRASKHTPKSKCGRTAARGIFTQRKWFKEFMQMLGFTWTPCMGIGTGCKVHLTDGELPMGRLIVAVSRHYTAVIDGVIHDLYSPERNVTEIGRLNGVDYKTTRRRCVYGYWKLMNDA